MSPSIQNRIFAYPYFIFHYTFNKVILTNPELAVVWANAMPFDASPPQRLQWYANHKAGPSMARMELSLNRWPLHKLDWRVDAENDYWRGVFSLMDAASTRSAT